MTTGTLDPRFSAPGSVALPWPDVERLLVDAELYWLTTTRADGRPHVTPLVGVWHQGAFAFCTDPTEQKAHNLATNSEVAVTTGVNRWQSGVDVVVEGRAVRVTGRDETEPLAGAWRTAYGEDWPWQADDEGFVDGEHRPWVYRVTTTKVIAFAKDPAGQTTFRF